MSTIPVQVSLPCESCFVRPCGEDDIVCVECRGSIKARLAARKAHRHDFRDGDVCSTCDAVRGAA